MATTPSPLEIDIDRERLYLFREFARLGVFSMKMNYHTVWRYAVVGRRNRSGAPVFLEYINTPTGYATSVEAFRRFIHNLNE